MVLCHKVRQKAGRRSEIIHKLPLRIKCQKTSECSINRPGPGEHDETAKKHVFTREPATLAAVTAEAYRSCARNEQPWRGSVISPAPAETAYAPFLKKTGGSVSP